MYARVRERNSDIPIKQYEYLIRQYEYLIRQYEYLIRQYENLSMGNEKRGKIRGNDIASSVIVSYCLESE